MMRVVGAYIISAKAKERKASNPGFVFTVKSILGSRIASFASHLPADPNSSLISLGPAIIFVTSLPINQASSFKAEKQVFVYNRAFRSISEFKSLNYSLFFYY